MARWTGLSSPSIDLFEQIRVGLHPLVRDTSVW